MKERICHKLRGRTSSSEGANEDKITIIEYNEQEKEVLFVFIWRQEQV